ncbi:tail fiber assembly protein [Xenorhabdus khoisanae]|uniref:Tail fiber assembly protein n=1 Tax=Xenorhabdus khoisanae TaxID=880157 RepID=A0A0J5ILG5_9GAMM|nr:tail fiber assembly protein [Xenorhabdus khoisanae]KMJ44005.1 tail fiber assembly protein [Xenorhabdus khoisanae]
MLHLKNFSRYSPDTDEEKKIELEFQAIFYRSENGDDWYKDLLLFKEETYKIKYDTNNVICSISKKASTICPEAGSVVELEYLPDDVDISGNWQYINGDIVQRKYEKNELIIQAKKKKQELLSEANFIILPLQDAVDLAIETEQEMTALTEWKSYRVMINRIDCSFAPDIKWPKKPN